MSARIPPRGRGSHVLTAVALVLALSSWACAQERSRPGPFIFIHGLQGAGAAATLASTGCNTVYYDLPIDAPEDLDDVRANIADAHARDLQVIVGLPTKLDGRHRISAHNEAYVAACRDWITQVVGGLRDCEGIAAWATGHDLERDLSDTPQDLRGFLLEHHGSLAALNRSWRTEYGHIDAITAERIRELDRRQMYGVGRPSVDLAEYHRRAFHDVMALWAEAIRAVDPDRTLMTGRISLYRSLTAIPAAYDVVQPHMPPDILEPDTLTHNVHAVEMARRGGRFEVIPWLRVPLPPSDAYSQSALTRWVLEAGLRGAVGVGLESWERICDADWVRNNLLDHLAAGLRQRPFAPEPPRPCVAVIYEPYAAGHQFLGTPAYGFLQDYQINDLATLAFTYRFGTVFGGMDFICPEDLSAVDLDAYSAILAPACLSLPPTAASTLSAWVERGGALFADLGIGMYQVQSWQPERSPLAAVLGIAGSRDAEDRYGTYRVGEQHPALPSVRVGMEAEGTFVPGEGRSLSMGHVSRYSYRGPATQTEGNAFQGPSWFIRPTATAVPLATQSVHYDDHQRPYFLGLTVNTVGSGLGVFAPFAAWSHWPPQDALHAAVHGDLFGRRALYRLASNRLVDTTVGISGSEDALHLLRRSGVSSAEVLSAAADHRVHLGATCTASAASRDATGRRTGVMRLAVEVPPGGMAHCEAVPVRIRPESGQAHARIVAYGPGLIALEMGGDGSSWGSPRRGAPERFHGGVVTRVRLNVDDGVYPVEPGSTHHVSVREGREQERSQTVEADHRGRLNLWVSITGGRVSITPAQAPGVQD